MQVALIVATAALAGCNAIFGLESTHEPDAAGPRTCTTDAPSFKGKAVAIEMQPTHYYSISRDRSLAVGVRAGTLYEGPGDSELTMGSNLPQPLPGAPDSPRLSPEGDELFVRFTQGALSSTVQRYQRDNGMWTSATKLFDFNAPEPNLSAPTRRDLGPRHMMITVGGELREYVEDTPDTWREILPPYKAADFGTMAMSAPNLTSDGLHLIFQGGELTALTLIYASRTTIDARFTQAVDANPFFGAPPLDFPYLLEDCSRLYFFARQPQGVYYVEP